MTSTPHKLFVLVLVVLANACLSDLRPEGLAASTPEDVAKGRALLATAARVGGADIVAQHASYVVTFRDVWQGIAKWSAPWPAPDIEAKVEYGVGNFDARAEILTPEFAGMVVGAQSFRFYQGTTGKKPTFGEDEEMVFLLAATHYFFELATRLGTADVVRFAGQRKLGDTTYDLVFVSWQTEEPNPDYDQYLVYINPKTHLIDKASYTLRDSLGFMEFTMHFDDYRDVDGVWVSHRQSVTDSPEDADNFLHRITVTDYELRKTAPNLVVDPTLRSGDFKP